MGLVEVGVGDKEMLQLFLDKKWSVVVTLEQKEEVGEVTHGLTIISGLIPFLTSTGCVPSNSSVWDNDCVANQEEEEKAQYECSWSSNTIHWSHWPCCSVGSRVNGRKKRLERGLSPSLKPEYNLVDKDNNSQQAQSI
jgi:hypothetical protein